MELVAFGLAMKIVASLLAIQITNGVKNTVAYTATRIQLTNKHLPAGNISAEVLGLLVPDGVRLVSSNTKQLKVN